MYEGEPIEVLEGMKISPKKKGDLVALLFNLLVLYEKKSLLIH